MTNLSAKQLKFAIEYAKSGNATESATLAGYSLETAKQQGSRLLTNVAVSQYILHLKSKMEDIFIQEAKNSLLAVIQIRDNKKTSDTVRLRACQDILDRAGYRASDKIRLTANVEHSGSIASTKEVHIITELVNRDDDLADAILNAFTKRNAKLNIPNDDHE